MPAAGSAYLEKQLGLPAQRPAQLAFRIDDRVLLLSHPHRLAAPLRDRTRRLQLDRPPHARDHLRVAAAGNAVLVVPQPDDRARAVAVEADRVRVDRAVDPLLLHPRTRGGEDLVARAARPQLLHDDVLERVGDGERAHEARRGVRLAGQEQIGEVLRVGVEARQAGPWLVLVAADPAFRPLSDRWAGDFFKTTVRTFPDQRF